ncbi:hypothetical protein [Prochlorococcus marinus]|uniref:hypothetical protein n=1 Tax=Prochlorococcus marinus TaxID=1219 RepID=UPI000B06FFC4|nr:hypothetical protein [Prochlorococcus marinus]
MNKKIKICLSSSAFDGLFCFFTNLALANQNIFFEEKLRFIENVNFVNLHNKEFKIIACEEISVIIRLPSWVIDMRNIYIHYNAIILGLNVWRIGIDK